MLLDPRGHSGNIISKVPDTLIEESNKSEKELYVWNIAIWFGIKDTIIFGKIANISHCTVEL